MSSMVPCISLSRLLLAWYRLLVPSDCLCSVVSLACSHHCCSFAVTCWLPLHCLCLLVSLVCLHHSCSFTVASPAGCLPIACARSCSALSLLSYIAL
ncbi:hypothetical protein BD769DRAFT_1445106 [Suillus cothurnatus]|nr:hypothetical protein BD769DRAFT_1445106 [Suillus cothurnatus]